VSGVGSYTWGSTPQMVADVQNWLNNPTNNFGWLVLGNEAVTGSAKRFASNDNPASAEQPALTIDTGRLHLHHGRCRRARLQRHAQDRG
jgi:hypothetical protein